jgi:hypothetical protein
MCVFNGTFLSDVQIQNIIKITKEIDEQQLKNAPILFLPNKPSGAIIQKHTERRE